MCFLQKLVCAIAALVHKHMGSQHQQPHRQRGRKTRHAPGKCVSYYYSGALDDLVMFVYCFDQP